MRRPARRAWIGGGGALIAACAAGLVWQANEGGAISTARGEVRHVPLPDGSTMLLNTQSRVRVAMRPHERRLKMSSGEAWFQVQRDPARPFIVEVGSVRVRAVGTAFSVRRRDLGVEILVTEGVVEAWLVGREANRIRLSAGQKAMVAETSPIKQLDTAPSELDRRLAWRSGRIDLAGETLAEAVEEFNRYNARQIYVAQPELNSRKLYGIFRVDDPDGFSRAIHYSLNAQISTSNSLIIIGG